FIRLAGLRLVVHSKLTPTLITVFLIILAMDSHVMVLRKHQTQVLQKQQFLPKIRKIQLTLQITVEGVIHGLVLPVLNIGKTKRRPLLQPLNLLLVVVILEVEVAVVAAVVLVVVLERVMHLLLVLRIMAVAGLVKARTMIRTLRPDLLRTVKSPLHVMVMYFLVPS
ncbi:hypothetical protein C6379_25455, partial [Pseudomonas syringae pv. actinidiae]